jgi:hypothetical protein
MVVELLSLSVISIKLISIGGLTLKITEFFVLND